MVFGKITDRIVSVSEFLYQLLMEIILIGIEVEDFVDECLSLFGRQIDGNEVVGHLLCFLSVNIADRSLDRHRCIPFDRLNQ